MATPADLLMAWIGRRASPEALAWLESKQAEVARDPAPRVFAAAFGALVRRMGKTELALVPADLAAAEAARPGWRAAGLTVNQAARIVLLLDAAIAAGSFTERLKSLVGWLPTTSATSNPIGGRLGGGGIDLSPTSAVSAVFQVDLFYSK
jgi:hypothetical protein